MKENKKITDNPRTQADDRSVLLRVLEGDKEAFRIIIDRYKRQVFQITLRYTGSMGDAEDLSQEVFIRVFKKLPKYNPSFSFAGWLYTIAVNTCLNYLRSKRREREILTQYATELLDDMKYSPDMENGLVAKELLLHIGNLLPRLKPKFREAFILRCYLNMSYEEIAKITSYNQAAVRQNVLRARRQILELLDTSI